jgi:drug/metabolite transporter (DMT)-like permease
MTRHARWAILLALVTAAGEAVLQALVTSDWANPGSHALLFAFLIGPPLFLALLAWRRRKHPARSRLLFGVAALIAVGGLGVLGYNLYQFHTDPRFATTENMSGLIVPLAQWGLVMAVWLGLVIVEGREKPPAGQAGQVTQPAGGQPPTNSQQSS